MTTAQNHQGSGPVARTLVIGGLDTRDEAGPQNTDVLILARIDTQTGNLRAISIPRDLYVTIPGLGVDKINRAFDLGQRSDDDWDAGADLLGATIDRNFGVTVDGTVLTTFDGFSAVIDAVGGVEVVNPYDVYDAEYPTEDFGTKEIFYRAGPLHLNGDEALEFCRTRHQDTDGGRVMRQQLVLRALLDRIRDRDLGSNVAGVLTRLRDAVWTDVSWQQQLSLAMMAREVEQESLVFSSLVPLLSSGYTAEGAWIYTGDWSQIAWYVQAFLDGTAEPLS
jgi:LCP family protein required for cell wall assembly